MALSERAVAAMRRVGNTSYTAIPSYGLYPAAGVSDDWVMGALGVKYTFTIELPPADWDLQLGDQGFIVDESQIIPISREAWTGISVVVDRVLQDSYCMSC